MRIFFILFTMLGFLTSNCSAADKKQEREITIQTTGARVSVGLLISELDDEEKTDLKVERGALVLNVVDESEAEKAGFKKNDVIIGFNDQDIETAKELNDIAEDLEEEATAKFIIVREGKEQTLQATFKKSSKQTYSFSSSDDGDFSWNSSHDDLTWVSEEGDVDIIVNKMKDGLVEIKGGVGKGGFLGVEAKALSDQMLEYFEVKFGVLVETVVENSAAQKAGLKAGDIITHIEDREIKNYYDLVRTVNYYNPGETIEIDFVRKGSKKSVDAKLEKRKHGGMFIDEDGEHTIIKEFIGKPEKGMKKGLFKMKEFKNIGKDILYII